MMRILVCWMLIAGAALAEGTTATTNVVESVKTNQVNTVKAKEAMSVLEADKEVEAAEVAETVRIAQEGTNKVSTAKETKVDLIKKLIKPEPAVKEVEKVVDPWDAFMPPPDSEFDWIQLTSGEWLKGDFKVLYDYEIEFDSDEMDLQTFDLEDVKRMRTRGMKTIFIQGEGGRRDTEVLRGMLELKENELILRRSEFEVTVPRERVISIAGGRQRERDNWSGMLSLGINARGGNTETTDTTVMANIKRRTAATRFNADYIANYSSSAELETANNQRLNGNYDRFLTARFYWQLLAGEYYRDPFTNIDGQYSLSTGIGYDIVHTTKTEWSLGLGIGYQDQKFVSVEAGEDQRSSSPFSTFGTRFDHEVTGNLDFLFDYNMRWLNEANGTYSHHLLTKLSFDLIKDFDLDVSMIWDRVETPQADADGTLPEQNDYQLIVSLAYEF